MKVCKIRPDYSICSQCLDISDMSGIIPDCKTCKLNTDTYELLQIGTGFWSGDYAIVQKNGKITKVALSRVYDVRRNVNDRTFKIMC